MYVKAFIVNENKCLKPFFLEQHINIVNTVTLQNFWYFGYRERIIKALILILVCVFVVCLHREKKRIYTNLTSILAAAELGVCNIFNCLKKFVRLFSTAVKGRDGLTLSLKTCFPKLFTCSCRRKASVSLYQKG